MSPRIQKLAAFGAEQPHGTRSRYNSGCHCDECKAANRKYEHERTCRRIFHGPARVAADRARAHLIALQAAGLGRGAIGRAAEVNPTRIYEIAHGVRRHIAAATEQRILAVTTQDAADRAYIPAAESHRLIRDLVERGYTLCQLASWLGYGAPSLQFRSSLITKVNADRIAELYNRLNEGLVQRGVASVVVAKANIGRFRPKVATS